MVMLKKYMVTNLVHEGAEALRLAQATVFA
jgi:hypothetical protein